MKSLIVHLLSYCLGLYLTAQLVQGLYFDTIAALVLGAVVLTIVDAVVKPIVTVTHAAAQFLIPRLFTFVINGFMLKITSLFVPGWPSADSGAILRRSRAHHHQRVINWLVSD